MPWNRSVGLPLLCVIVGWNSSPSPSQGAASTPESVLKEKGLTKTVHTYVIEDEKPVLAKMKELRGVYNDYASAAEKQATAEDIKAQSALLEQNRVGLQSELNLLNQQIAQQTNSMPRRGGMRNMPTPLTEQRAQIQASLAEINQTQQVLKSQAVAPKDKAALDAEVKKKEEAFKTALVDFRKQVDEVTKKYDELKADESVKKAIDDLQKATKAKVNLGPSDALLAGLKDLDQAERKFLGKKAPTTASKKKAAAKTKK